jgi:hypothetical protein
MNNDSGLANARAKILSRRAKLASEMDRLMSDLRLLDDLLTDLGGHAETTVPATSMPATVVPTPAPAKKVGGARMHAVNGVPHPESRKGMLLLYLAEHQPRTRSDLMRAAEVSGSMFKELSNQFFPQVNGMYSLNAEGLAMAEKIKELRNNLPATPAL